MEAFKKLINELYMNGRIKRVDMGILFDGLKNVEEELVEIRNHSQKNLELVIAEKEKLDALKLEVREFLESVEREDDKRGKCERISSAEMRLRRAVKK